MIEKLHHHKVEVSKQIYLVFQLSYTVEAKLLGSSDFPPLRRPLEKYVQSNNEFFGYFEEEELAGVVEVETMVDHIDINSLVVKPDYFRRGIGRKLMEFVFEKMDADLYVVETGIENKPATALYMKLGFQEVKQWDTDFGIRKVKFEKRVSC